MSKPNDIPEEVWEAAEAINDILAPSGVAKIARALMAAEERGRLAERERCARLIDAQALPTLIRTDAEGEPKMVFTSGARAMRTVLSTAIRTQRGKLTQEEADKIVREYRQRYPHLARKAEEMS